jgi:hypothetical protein
MNTISNQGRLAICLAVALFIAGCSDMKTPATANVAVSSAAVDNASTAGGSEYAPQEMRTARDELAQANIAMTNKDYKKADDLAKAAQADAKLAQSKADTAKAQAAAAALQSDIQVLQDQINHSNQNP